MPQTQKSKPRLGRGLSSLIPGSNLPVEVEVGPADPGGGPGRDSASQQTQISGQPSMIPIHQIRPNPHQPRRTIREAAIAELAVSIKTSGIIQPIIVRQVDGGYELIAGERRWLAAKLANLAEVPAIIRNVDNFAQAQMALVENIQREDLNPIDRANGYKTLIDLLGLTQAELAERLGEDRSGIANYLRLLELAEPVRQMVRDGRISLGHAKILASVNDILTQQRLAETVVSQSLSVRNLERLLAIDATGKTTRQTAAPSAHLADLEKTIARQLGMRVQIRAAGKGKGRLVIHYATLDQFDEVLQKLGVKGE
jgi:ParB family transcriptional regulator, chromosome partitioning protein